MGRAMQGVPEKARSREKLILIAYAKINLTLEVLGRRSDGYHEIAAVLQTIDLRDELFLETAETIQLTCNPPSLATSDNLALRAAHLLQEMTDSAKGVAIHLVKGIPEAGGLGGGSSDAAAILRGLNRLWGLNWPLASLHAIAARLGSDVPFFLYQGTALVRGRGEVVLPLPHLPPRWLVLLRPRVPVPPQKTAALYAALHPSHFSRGELTAEAVATLQRGVPLEPEFLANVFEKVAFQFFTGLEEYRRRFQEAGASQVHLAGSGPALFSFVENQEQGQRVRNRLVAQRLESYLVSTVNTLGAG